MVRLTELVLVIEGVTGDRSPFWDRFLTLSERTGSACSAYPALYFANGLVEDVVPEAVLQILPGQAPAAARRVMDRFMFTRTFPGWMRELSWFLFPDVALRAVLSLYAKWFWILADGRSRARISSS